MMSKSGVYSHGSQRMRRRLGMLLPPAILVSGVMACEGAVAANLRAGGHEAQCPRCKREVVQDTPRQDNEVAIRYGMKRIEYRCVSCALAEALSEYKDDLTILAPSEVKGRPVLITRKSGRWSVLPKTAVFVGEGRGHAQCHVANRAFSGKAAFQAYIRRNAGLLRNARPRTLGDMLQRAPAIDPPKDAGKESGQER